MKRQVICLNLKNNRLTLAWRKRNTAEAFQFQARSCNIERFPRDIKLCNLSSRALPRVSDLDRRLNDFSRMNFSS